MDAWRTEREERIRHWIELDFPRRVVFRTGGARDVRHVSVTYRRTDGGVWKRSVSVTIGRGWNMELKRVPEDLRTIPGWLEDIMRTAEGMER